MADWTNNPWKAAGEGIQNIMDLIFAQIDAVGNWATGKLGDFLGGGAGGDKVFSTGRADSPNFDPDHGLKGAAVAMGPSMAQEKEIAVARVQALATPVVEAVRGIQDVSMSWTRGNNVPAVQASVAQASEMDLSYLAPNAGLPSRAAAIGAGYNIA